MGRIYRINPTCPFCLEEHMYWDIQLTDEEQEKLDHHTKEHSVPPLESLLSPPAIIVTRTLKCGCCKKTFEKNIGIRKEDEVVSNGLPSPVICSHPPSSSKKL